MKASAVLIIAGLAFLMPQKILALSDTPDEEVVRSIEESPRILIINGRQSVVDQQLHIFGFHQKGFLDRDMIVIKSVYPDVIKPSETIEPQIEVVDALSEDRFRNDELSLYNDNLDQLEEGNKLQIQLIGKDGGIKKRWNRLIDEIELFFIIDAMPMRMKEMREQK